MSDTLEHTARRIAEQGSDALIARLRPAFAEAAARHAEVLALDPEQLEAIVQRAADRADGLQWRRALASVAVAELGISLSEALTHPAVARAQTILGVPSYEDSIAKLALAGARAGTHSPPQTTAPPESAPAIGAPSPAGDAGDPGVPAPMPAAPAHAERTTGEAAQLGGSGGATQPAYPDTAWSPAPLPAPGAATASEVAASEVAGGPEAVGAAAGAESAQTGGVALHAIHLGGVANLRPTESEIELWILDDGLQFVRGGQVFERLSWAQIRGVEVHDSRRLRRRGHGAQLLLRSDRGEASFEIRGVAPKELRALFGPLLARR